MLSDPTWTLPGQWAAAVLFQVLTSFGSVICRSAYFVAERDRHYGNLFCCLVGDTSKGRKGSSWSNVREIMKHVDDEWYRHHVMSGLSSGEGLVWAVRGPVIKQERIEESGHDRYEESSRTKT